MATLARKFQEIFMTTVLTSHTGKPVVQNPAVQVPQHHLPDIGAIKSVLPLKPFFVDLFEGFEIYPVKCRFAALLQRI